MSAQGKWRVGRRFGIHVYAGDTPIATFVGPQEVAEEHARAVVAAHNATGEPVEWQLYDVDDARWLTISKEQYDECPAMLRTRVLYAAPQPAFDPIAVVEGRRQYWIDFKPGVPSSSSYRDNMIAECDEIIRALNDAMRAQPEGGDAAGEPIREIASVSGAGDNGGGSPAPQDAEEEFHVNKDKARLAIDADRASWTALLLFMLGADLDGHSRSKALACIELIHAKLERGS